VACKLESARRDVHRDKRIICNTTYALQRIM